MTAPKQHTFDHHPLRIYSAVARHLNMRRAAAELGMAPSGVSRALTTLEKQWGCRLFERSSRRLALSRSGREFLPLVDAVLERLQALGERLANRQETPRQHFRIGAAPTIGQRILPAVLREFRETFPQLTVQCALVSSRQAEQALVASELDLAVVVQPGASPGLAFEPLADDDLHFVTHPLHPWAVERRVRIEDLQQRRLILPDRRDDTFALIEAYFRDEGVTIEPFAEIAGEDAIKECVRLDLAAGILPRWLVRDEVARGLLALLPPGRRRLRRQWGILHAREHPLDFAEQLFANLCGAVLRDQIGPIA